MWFERYCRLNVRLCKSQLVAEIFGAYHYETMVSLSDLLTQLCTEVLSFLYKM